MKTRVKSKSLLLATVAVLFTATAFAQQPEQKACQGPNIPNLTEEQKSKIEALKPAHMKEMANFKAELDVLEAELRQLEIADNADLNKINAKIDEISAVENKMAKERSKHHQSVRSILTPEQRVAFDAKGCMGQKHQCMQGGEKKGCGKMQGEGNGPGKCSKQQSQN